MNENDFVSIILPCYNERGNIIPLIEAIHSELFFCKHQIIMVDDNSPDGTFQLVQEKKYDFVKTILRTQDPSLAKSIRKGIEEADGNILVVMDSDFNHQPTYIPQLVKNIEYYDCVSASRFLYGGKMNSRFRHLASWVFNVFVRIMTRQSITDSLYGFFAIKKEVISKLNFDKIFWGYGDYDIRFMYYLQKQNASILQIPAVNGERLKGEGNSRFIKTFFQYAMETFRLVLFSK
jgi:dolichol-phosphate mannosyltransferase